MNTPNLDYSNLKNDTVKTEVELYTLWEEQVKILEKQYHEDCVIKKLRRQRIDILEKAIPVSINNDYSPVYDKETQQNLNYLEKQLNNYIMRNYIDVLYRMSYNKSE